MRPRQFLLVGAGVLAGVLAFAGLATAGSSPPQGYLTVTTLTAQSGEVTVQVFQPTETIQVSAILTNGRAPVPTVGATMDFTVVLRVTSHQPPRPPLLICSAVTDSSGTASCSGTFSRSLLTGVHTYTASFAGTSDLQPSSATGALH